MLALSLAFAFTATADVPSAKSSSTADARKIGQTNQVFRPVRPGPADGRIAFVTAKMLEQMHYLRQPFNDATSSKFLDRYLDLLDPQKLHFLQADLEHFELYRTNLDNVTITRRGMADVLPAAEIFNRFMLRLQQRVSYADQLLASEKFAFNTDEKLVINRKDAPAPKDLDAARKLWHQRLRFEYLQEHLGKIESRKKAEKDKREAAPGYTEGKPKTEHEEIVTTLTNRYHRTLRAFQEWDNDDVLQVYLSALSHVYDPHSDYMGAEQLESFAMTMNLSLFGIGAELLSEDGYCTIRRLLPGGPAEKSKKVKEKDRIVAVAQSNQPPVDVVDMTLSKAVQLIRGPKGTEVSLTIIPAGESSSRRQVVTLIRDEIKLEDQEAKAKVIDLPNKMGAAPLRLGVIDLPSFYATFNPMSLRGKAEAKSTTDDVAKLLKKLKQENVSGIVLDLRRNGGGSLEEAIRLTGLFIKEGPVVQSRDTDGRIQIKSDRDGDIAYEGPLIVLTSRFSASASEILAGALQDYGRALIVGDISTHGKGTVQSVNELKPFMADLTNEPGALKLTIATFFRASGASTQLKGVVPDVVLPSILNESQDIGEASLDFALPFDTIDAAKYEPFNLVAPVLAELKQRSAERVASGKDWAYVREDMALFKKRQADKTISLNEKVRLKEKTQEEARAKEREKERKSRAESEEKVYEITLKNASLPGLPPPVQKTNALAKAGLSGASTNALAEVPGKDRPEDIMDAPGDDELAEDSAPAVDITLQETEKILADYITLLRAREVAKTSQKN